jgi:hypothetical protein
MQDELEFTTTEGESQPEEETVGQGEESEKIQEEK